MQAAQAATGWTSGCSGMTHPDRTRAGQGSHVGSSGSTDELEAAVSGLAQMHVTGLRSEWRRLYRSEPPKKLRRDTLQLAVAWKLQARVLGGLSPAVTRQLAELADVIAGGSKL